MSKKIFLKKSYADAVKGPTQGKTEFTTDPDPNDSSPGHIELKPQWTGFRYSTTSPITIHSTDSDASPVKSSNAFRQKRKAQFKLHHSLTTDDSPIIITESSDDCCSPAKRLSKSNHARARRNTSRELFPGMSSDSDSSLPDIEIDQSIGDVVVEHGDYQVSSKRDDIDDDDASLPSLQYPVRCLKTSISHLLTGNKDQMFQTFYNGDCSLPVYKSLKHGISTKEAVLLLLKDLNSKELACNIPSGIDKNVSFVYSIEKLGHWKNALCDGMGRWTQKGTHTETVFVDLKAETVKPCTPFSDNVLQVSRRSYLCKSCDQLHRIVITLQDPNTDQMLDHLFVQYYFEGQEQQVEVQPHGNSNRNEQFTRTSETVKERIQELCKNNLMKPKKVFHTIVEEQGGLETVQSGAMIPKDRQQIKNFKKSIKSSQYFDPLMECTDLAKKQETQNYKFIRDVRSAPEFTMFLATDQQLKDLTKYCTANRHFSVLGVDTTFNIVTYYITVTTYRNLMLNTKSGHEPVMIGPVLLHQRKTFDSYFKLPSLILQECPNLRNLKVYGTDGDENLSNAFQVCFPQAKHLLCDIHMVDNIDRKLRSLSITGNIAKQYSNDIFGYVLGDSKFKGLVDCFSQDEFTENLCQLKGPWIQRHQNGKPFWEYFLEHKSELIKQSMMAELRSMCGLGFPPKTYNQNANESINSVIKNDLLKERGQKLDPYEFVVKLEKIINQQYNEVKLALIGKGEYRLKSEYSHLGICENYFWRKTKEQREAVYRRFFQEPLQSFVPGDDLNENDRGDLPTLEQSSQSLKKLKISAEESEIICIPFWTLADMFSCAEDLLSDCDNIKTVPGCKDNKSFFIKNSLGLASPHLLKYAPTTLTISCDSQCRRFQSFKLCQHSIALAQHLDVLSEYLTKYRRQSPTGNITSLSNHNMPRNRGSKATKATQRRKGKANCLLTAPVQYARSRAVNKDNEQPFRITFMAGLIKKCYGCGQQFTSKTRMPPNDLLLKRFDHRMYQSPKSKEKRKSIFLQNTYFHLNADCARRVCPSFEMCQVLIHNEIKDQLTEEHKRILSQLQIKYDWTSEHLTTPIAQ